MTETTTILGTAYAGRPMFGSFALKVWLTERREGRAAAQRQVQSHFALCDCRYKGEALADGSHDFSADMTDVPMEGVTVVSKGGHRHVHS